MYYRLLQVDTQIREATHLMSINWQALPAKTCFPGKFALITSLRSPFHTITLAANLEMYVCITLVYTNKF